MEQIKKTILLIEDDKFITRAYKDGLKRAGFKVDVASDGKEGMEKMRLNKPDLILLDLIIPIKDGFDVLEEMRMDDELKNSTVIILSNLGQDSDIEKGKMLGAVDYLIKTECSMNEVIEKVKFCLAMKK